MNNLNTDLEKSPYWLWKSEIPEELIALIEAENPIEKAAAGTLAIDGTWQDSKVRKSDVILHGQRYWPAGIALNYALMANAAAGWNYDVNSVETVQIAFYQPDQYYDWHCDTFVLSKASVIRKITVIIGLSSVDDYEGGELQIFDENTSLKLGRGDVIVMPSILQHRVKPVTAGLRKSLASWTLGPAFR